MTASRKRKRRCDGCGNPDASYLHRYCEGCISPETNWVCVHGGQPHVADMRPVLNPPKPKRKARR